MTASDHDDSLTRVTDSPHPPKRPLQGWSLIGVAAVVSTLAVILAAVVAGCGTNSTGTKSSQSSSTARTSSNPASGPPKVSTPTTSPTTTSPAPPTVINASCKPPSQHPYPVVLLPGTYGITSWQLIGPQLAQLGYCVSTFAYGNNGTGDIATSAQQLATMVDRLRARTGAGRVSIVGHSEGGMMPRYYIEFLGGSTKVDKLVALAPSNHGTLNPATFGGALTGCVACAQQQTGSAFLTHLNAGDETPPPVDYTVIETIYDEVVIPYTSAFLSGPASRVTNITLQQQCPKDLVGHIGITSDPVALQWVENALASKGPANPHFVPSC
jgi:triacylglycerol lipase